MATMTAETASITIVVGSGKKHSLHVGWKKKSNIANSLPKFVTLHKLKKILLYFYLDNSTNTKSTMTDTQTHR